MSRITKIKGLKVISTIDSYRRGADLLHCFLPGEQSPKNASSKLQVIKIIVDATKELKASGINDPQTEDYARYFCLLNNQALVKNALLFCTGDKEGARQLNEILNPEMKAIA